MKLISWNVENVLRCVPALPTIVEELGRPEVLCLQELRIRGRDEQAISALERALPGYRCHYSLPRDPRNVSFYEDCLVKAFKAVLVIGSAPVSVWRDRSIHQIQGRGVRSVRASARTNFYP